MPIQDSPRYLNVHWPRSMCNIAAYGAQFSGSCAGNVQSVYYSSGLHSVWQSWLNLSSLLIYAVQYPQCVYTLRHRRATHCF